MNDYKKISSLNLKNKKAPLRLSNTQKLLLLLMFIVAMTTMMPILVVLLIGLLPTFTLMIIDIKNINKLIIVGCFNLSGVFIYMFSVLRDFSMGNALFIFSDIFNMILMLGAAAIGLIVYYEIPMLFLYIARSANQRRISSIDAKIEKLQSIWGTDIVVR